MNQTERHLWWYRMLHSSLIKVITHFAPQQKTATALDIGCGTGIFLQQLASLGYQPFGLELSAEGLNYCRESGLKSLTQADANSLPFANSCFDLVVSLDVLETEGINPQNFISEIYRVLKPGGYALIQAAALQCLLSQHDQAVNSVKRYTSSELSRLCQESGLSVKHKSYLFFLLFPLMAIHKLLNPLKDQSQSIVSDIRLPNSVLNSILYLVCCLERLMIPQFSLPIGTSVFVVARKLENEPA